MVIHCVLYALLSLIFMQVFIGQFLKLMLVKDIYLIAVEIVHNRVCYVIVNMISIISDWYSCDQLLSASTRFFVVTVACTYV